TKLSNGNTTSCNRGQLISARSPRTSEAARAPTPAFDSNYSGRAKTCAALLERALSEFSRRSYVARSHSLREQFVRGYLGHSFGLLSFAHGQARTNSTARALSGS